MHHMRIFPILTDMLNLVGYTTVLLDWTVLHYSFIKQAIFKSSNASFCLVKVNCLAILSIYREQVIFLVCLTRLYLPNIIILHIKFIF